ncbi:hypothetical protein V9L05_20040 [Bernardetia sp. Wsw4-3y2]|uniref:hypothetical protein n=1 Tax=Bernardetia sp. Wsw4-3y2 TaxID=3127471 RepID=UPI0030D1B674
MKKLQLFTGGHPNSLDDYEHIQEGHIESLNAVIAGLIFPNTACILTGCVFNGTTLTAGTLFYNNEVFYVDAQSITASVNDVWFIVNETVRNNTDVTYLDTTQRSVHLERKAILQAGGGGVGGIQYNTILRLEDILYTRLGISNLHYTKSEIDARFAAFRNGYEPTFRINPINSHLEWSYLSPPHPIVSGGVGNLWRDLGFPVQYYAGTGGGLFESRIDVNQILPPQPNQRSFIEFNNEIVDEGNTFNLGRTYTIPVSGEYEFGVDQLKAELVNNVIPNTNVDSNGVNRLIRLTISLWKNGIEITSANATITNGGDDETIAILRHGHAPYPIVDAAGTQYVFGGDLRLKGNFTQGDEVTVECSLQFHTDPSGLNQYIDEMCENVRIAYRIVEGRFYTV